MRAKCPQHEGFAATGKAGHVNNLRETKVPARLAVKIR